MFSGVAIHAVVLREGTGSGEVLAFGAVSAGDGGVELGVSSGRAVCASAGSGGAVGACI